MLIARKEPARTRRCKPREPSVRVDPLAFTSTRIPAQSCRSFLQPIIIIGVVNGAVTTPRSWKVFDNRLSRVLTSHDLEQGVVRLRPSGQPYACMSRSMAACRTATRWARISSRSPASRSSPTPISSSFCSRRQRRLKRGVFRSITDFQAAINRYLAEHNENPKPFVWKADPSRVLAAIERGKQALESVH